jgi:hypothetical protein
VSENAQLEVIRQGTSHWNNWRSLHQIILIDLKTPAKSGFAFFST